MADLTKRFNNLINKSRVYKIVYKNISLWTN